MIRFALHPARSGQTMPATPKKIYLASSNPGKLRELVLAAGAKKFLKAELFPHFDQLLAFAESHPSFALNAAGKALHYSRFADELVLADDSGLAVEALGGAPGPGSARYAGAGSSDADRIQKLLQTMQNVPDDRRGARFICVLVLAHKQKLIALFSDSVEGRMLTAPRGTSGFGYDPVFFYEPLGKSFAEISREEKNLVSHRGKAFRKLIEFLAS